MIDRETIERLAREAGIVPFVPDLSTEWGDQPEQAAPSWDERTRVPVGIAELERLCSLLRCEVLEAAAQACERKVDSARGIVLGPGCADAIRALKSVAESATGTDAPPAS